MRLLVVEDDPELAASVCAFLRASGFAVDHAADGRRALELSAMNPYDAVVLDLRLPDVDGLEVCRALRSRRGGLVPRIIMATARDAIDDRVSGLDHGADDYLVKPYALPELVARLRALLRRPAEAVPETLRVGDLTLDTATRRAMRNGRAIELTTKEFAVLEYLMRHEGRVLTRERISEHAWDDNYDPASNVIDVYIGRLRRKIDAEREAPLLATVRGAGYRIGDTGRRAGLLGAR
jgi:two-component system copper resistance phosphate regulon response regulator CusR